MCVPVKFIEQLLTKIESDDLITKPGECPRLASGAATEINSEFARARFHIQFKKQFDVFF